MKHLKFILLATLAFAFAACSSSRELTAEEIYNHNMAVSLLKNKQFMVTANKLILDKRTFPSVSASTNFVAIDGNNAVVQVSPGNAGGPNGVGGFTVKGSVTKYELNERSNGTLYLRIDVQASAGSCSIFINLPKDASVASVNIQNTFRGKTATIYGPVTKIDNSIFVGRHL